MASPKGVSPDILRMKKRQPNLSNSEISRRIGCSPQNVDYVLGKYLGQQTEEELRQFQDNQADIFDAVAMRSLTSITPKKLSNASAVQLMTAAAIATDKARLVRGQATGINVSVLMDVVEAIKARKT